MRKGYGKYQCISFRTRKPKKKFFTADQAISDAKRMNEEQDSAYKYIAYKCGVCHKYHIGKSNKQKTK